MKTIFLLLLVIPFSAFNQNQNNIWYFGGQRGINFNGGSAVQLNNSQISQKEGTAVICNPTTGSLLFYTNGMDVYNRNHVLMANGVGLYGAQSSGQSALIVPKPGSTTRFYIFTTDALAGISTANAGAPHYYGGLAVSEVNMALNGGLGDVIFATKNTPLLTPTSEKLTGVKHCNGIDTWVICHGINNNNFYSYLVTSSGVQSPIVSSVGSTPTSTGVGSQTMGYMQVSPLGNKIATQTYTGSGLELFDFSTSSGIVSNAMSISSNPNVFGVCFSPDGTKLYTSEVLSSGSGGNLFQYNLTAGGGCTASAITASQTVVRSNPILLPGSQNYFGAMQLAPNGKIYVNKFQQNALDVINTPNGLGSACGYSVDGFVIGGSGGFVQLEGLPNYVVTPPSNCSSLPVNPCSPLPVELSTFYAECNNLNVDFKWTTESENSNNYFIIEKSTDGENWEQFATIPSLVHTSTVAQNYAYSYRPNNQDLYLYRLSQVDFNGDKTKFDPIVLQCSATDFSLSPNPATNLVYITGDKQNITSITCSDATGRVVRIYSTAEIQNGLLDISQLSNGGYVFQIGTTVQSYYLKLIKGN